MLAVRLLGSYGTASGYVGAFTCWRLGKWLSPNHLVLKLNLCLLYAKKQCCGVVVDHRTCAGRVTSSTPRLAHKILPLCVDAHTPLGRGHVSPSHWSTKCSRPIMCHQVSRSNWATYGNILGIFFLLTGLYGCQVSIPITKFSMFDKTENML